MDWVGSYRGWPAILGCKGDKRRDCTLQFSCQNYSHDATFLSGECVTGCDLHPGDGGPRCPEQVFTQSSVLETLAGNRYKGKQARRHFWIHLGL